MLMKQCTHEGAVGSQSIADEPAVAEAAVAERAAAAAKAAAADGEAAVCVAEAAAQKARSKEKERSKEQRRGKRQAAAIERRWRQQMAAAEDEQQQPGAVELQPVAAEQFPMLAATGERLWCSGAEAEVAEDAEPRDFVEELMRWNLMISKGKKALRRERKQNLQR